MKNILLFTLAFLGFQIISQAQKIKSGPMLGYIEMKEAAIWLQTDAEAEVYISYALKEGSKGISHRTKTIQTRKDKAFTATLIADELEPGSTYEYQIYINGILQELDVANTFTSQYLWRYRNDAPDFNFLIGSCSYINETRYDRPSKPYGGEYQIFEKMADESADFMLWLGDNIYLREADWFTRTGIYHRYSHMRSTPELKRLLANTHHYAIWDDHDFGPNDADRSFIHKEITREAFEDFWANNFYGIDGSKGITGFFQYHDMDFFLLDNRYYRTPIYTDPVKRHILGKEQVEWLIDALKFSRAPFKFIAVGGQFLNTAEVFENHAVFPSEREYIIQRIKEENIKGVIFLNGDRHHSEVSKLDDGEVLIYDITCSPLTSGAVKNVRDVNTLRIDESLVNTRNYGFIEISGKYKERVAKLSLKGNDGNLLYTFEIKESEWRKP